jgi:trehalose-phosphatase
VVQRSEQRNCQGEIAVPTLDQVPLVWEREGEIRARLEGRSPVVFLDYDGTLTPIVEDHTKAVLSDDMRATVAALARRCQVAIVSGRDVATMRDLVRLDALYYAGSHGFEIGGPAGWHDAIEKGVEALPDLDHAEGELRERLEGIPGHAVERKRFSIAIHYRRAAPGDVDRITRVVDRIASDHRQLRRGSGKKVLRLQPDIDWDKGHAVLWLLERLGLDRPDVVPMYIGDDVTDEDAMQVLRDRGIGIVVRGEDDARETAARYALADCDDVRRFLKMLTSLAEGTSA